jgi:hypothetical protein
VSTSRSKNYANTPQPDLFGDVEPPAPKGSIQVKPEHAREVLEQYLEELQSLETWPWEKILVDRLHSRTWPYFFKLLLDDTEAAMWKKKLEAETARLDAATTWAA